MYGSMRLRPSEIRYSQDSISNFFSSGSSHGGTMIGETLDELCEGRCSIYDIPTISVVNYDEHWVTTDNRRLWVFKTLANLGKCNAIPVLVRSHIFPDKLTRVGGGETIRVRGFGPDGEWYRRQFGYVLGQSSQIHSRQFGYDLMGHSPQMNEHQCGYVRQNHSPVSSTVTERSVDSDWRIVGVVIVIILIVSVLLLSKFWHS